MPFYLIHAGTTLQRSSPSGVLNGVTLPSGVTISDERPARMAILANKIVVVNAPSVNLFIDPFTNRARVLSITGPAAAPSVVAGASGQFDGQYRFYFTYAIVDANGDILTESPASPVAGPVTLSNRQASLSDLTTSSTADVNARIVYMTVGDGEGPAFFEADRVLNNTATTDTIDSSDFDLGLLSAANPKGNPPGVDGTDRLRLIVAWKDRLFASPLNEPDFVYVSGNRAISNWAESQRFTVKPQGEDEFGVTAFMPRRDELVIAKRRKLVKIVGNDPSDFEQVLIIESIGAVSQEAAIVIRDECYFLGEDGFYKYGNDGLISLSRDDVHPWFTTDTYFTRSQFQYAFAYHNQKFDTIHLHLAAAGSDVLNRWVRYDMKQKKWFGPDKTDLFTPSAGGAMDDANSFNSPVLAGSLGEIYRLNSSTASDDGVAIEFDVIGKFHAGNTPDIHKYWGQPAIITKVESAGTLSVIPTVGGLDAVAQSTISVDLTLGRARPRRLGTGRFCQLRFLNAEDAQSVTLYGYEIPTHELGRR